MNFSAAGSRGGEVTEARILGELKLVRKPPKVSRGCGGVARAASGPSGPGEAYRCRGGAKSGWTINLKAVWSRVGAWTAFAKASGMFLVPIFRMLVFPRCQRRGCLILIGRSSLFAMARSCDFGGPPFKTTVFLNVAILGRVEIRRTVIRGLFENVSHS